MNTRLAWSRSFITIIPSL